MKVKARVSRATAAEPCTQNHPRFVAATADLSGEILKRLELLLPMLQTSVAVSTRLSTSTILGPIGWPSAPSCCTCVLCNCACKYGVRSLCVAAPRVRSRIAHHGEHIIQRYFA